MATYVIEFITFLAALFVWNLLSNSLPSYSRKKGENLATKEDIDKLTDIVESIRTDYALKIEDHKADHLLRLSALDQRLRVHQKAFSLWWRLIHAVHTPEIGEAILRCERFWVRNCVYLSPSAEHAFRAAYRAALDHEQLVQSARGNPEYLEEMRANFKTIVSAGNELRDTIRLPPLNIKDLGVAEEGNRT